MGSAPQQKPSNRVKGQSCWPCSQFAFFARPSHFFWVGGLFLMGDNKEKVQVFMDCNSHTVDGLENCNLGGSHIPFWSGFQGKPKIHRETNWKAPLEGSLHYTPEHCNLYMVLSLYFGVEKTTCFNGCKMNFF